MSHTDSQHLAATRLPRLASSPAMKSSIPKPLSTGINANKRGPPSSPARPPSKRVVSNPLAQSTMGARKPGGFVPTTRKASGSGTLGSAVSATTNSRPTSSLAASTRRTASSTASTSTLGASRMGAPRSTIPAARRPPATATTRAAVGAGRSAGTSRGVSPRMAGSNIGSGMASMVQIKVSSVSIEA
jgi:hypothetical protein